MKSLTLLWVLGALLMGQSAQATEINQEGSYDYGDGYFAVSTAQLLAEKMHREGVRKELSLFERHDLEDIVRHAQNRANAIDLGCELKTLFEVRLQPELNSEMNWVAGYEAFLSCEDAPNPGLALYFDVDHQYLAEFASGL